MLAVATPMVGVSQVPSPIVVLSQDAPTVQSEAITTPEEKDRKERAAKIDAVLARYDSPLEGYGKKFVEAADENGIDFRLVAAIAGQESTFGKHACKKAANSFLGYGSCKISFKSVDEAIEKVSASLGGNNEATARHYDGKTTEQILKKYNSVRQTYSKEVMKIMKMIDPTKDIV